MTPCGLDGGKVNVTWYNSATGITEEPALGIITKNNPATACDASSGS
jgi:hypothetical protein